MKLEVQSDIDLNEISYQMLEKLSPEQIIYWFFAMVKDSGKQEKFYKLIKHQINLTKFK